MSKDIPVYIFLGMLESGKTKFIQETLEDSNFCLQGKTLLLVCEEGEEEYDEDKFAYGGTTVEYLEDKSELTTEHLQALVDKTGADYVMIEYNGMWMLNDLYNAMPENWVIAQVMGCADSSTIKMYAANNGLRALLLDKIAACEMMAFNRADCVNDDESRMEIHRLVRQASRRCDIVYEMNDGSVAYDDIPDPLPFDVNADIIDIQDDDYGVWFMDIQDKLDEYAGKTVRFTAQVLQTAQAGKDCFAPVRSAMTCCIEDIQDVGFPCKYKDAKKLANGSWIVLTAKITKKHHPIYGGGQGVVLVAQKVEPGKKPENEIVMFS